MKVFMMICSLLLVGCSANQMITDSPLGNSMTLDEASKPVKVNIGAGDTLGYQTFQEMGIFTPENILLYLGMVAISGFLMWREFVSKKR